MVKNSLVVFKKLGDVSATFLNNYIKQEEKFVIIFKKVLKTQKTNYICNPKSGGIIAQSVEQRTENPCVAGSIPADTTTIKSHLV
jgi:hypothetical protein